MSGANGSGRDPLDSLSSDEGQMESFVLELLAVVFDRVPPATARQMLQLPSDFDRDHGRGGDAEHRWTARERRSREVAHRAACAEVITALRQGNTEKAKDIYKEFARSEALVEASREPLPERSQHQQRSAANSTLGAGGGVGGDGGHRKSGSKTRKERVKYTRRGSATEASTDECDDWSQRSSDSMLSSPRVLAGAHPDDAMHWHGLHAGPPTSAGGGVANSTSQQQPHADSRHRGRAVPPPQPSAPPAGILPRGHQGAHHHHHHHQHRVGPKQTAPRASMGENPGPVAFWVPIDSRSSPRRDDRDSSQHFRTDSRRGQVTSSGYGQAKSSQLDVATQFERYEGSLRDQRMGAKSSQGGGRDADVVPSSAKSGRIATNGPSSLGAHADTFTYVDASRRGETGVGAGAHGAGGKQSPRSLVRQHASPSTWERSLRNGGHSSPVVDGGARLKQGGKGMGGSRNYDGEGGSLSLICPDGTRSAVPSFDQSASWTELNPTVYRRS